VRRIECLTGSGALDSLKRLEADVRELSDLLKVAPGEVVARTRKLSEQLKDKERELAEVKLKMASTSSGDAQAREIKGRAGARATHGRPRCERHAGAGRSTARQTAQRRRGALGAANDGKVSLLVVVTKDLVGRLKAGDLIKEMAVGSGRDRGRAS
jgi:alanyl-tRNA synthetase